MKELTYVSTGLPDNFHIQQQAGPVDCLLIFIVEWSIFSLHGEVVWQASQLLFLLNSSMNRHFTHMPCLIPTPSHPQAHTHIPHLRYVQMLQSSKKKHKVFDYDLCD